MASKALLVLGFLLAALVLISSEVAARELAENAKEVETEEPVNDAKQYGGGGGGYGYPGRGYPGRGYPGGGYPGRGYPGGGYPGRGCSRCCRYGSCRCCTEAELAHMTAEEKPHN